MTGLFVVETYDGQAYVGTLDREGNDLKVLTGFRGHPFVLRQDQVAAIVPAAEHPDVVLL